MFELCGLSKGFILSGLRSGRGGEKGQVLLMRYAGATTPSNIIEGSLRCSCLRWSACDEMDHIVCVKELEGGRVNVVEWYGVESLLSMMRSVPLFRSNISVQPFNIKLPCWHHRFYVNPFSVRL